MAFVHHCSKYRLRKEPRFLHISSTGFASCWNGLKRNAGSCRSSGWGAILRSIQTGAQNRSCTKARSCCISSYDSVFALRGFYGKCRSRCLLRVLALGRIIFPVHLLQSGSRDSWNLDTRFDCAGSHNVWVAVLGNAHVDVHLDNAGSHKVWS